MTSGGRVEARGGVLLDWWWRKIRIVLGSDDAGELDRATRHALVLVRAFYAFVLFLALPWSSQAGRAWMKDALKPARLELWVSTLVPHNSWLGADALATLLLSAGALTALMAPRLRFPRVVVALTFILHMAIAFDLKGKVDHGLHPALWVAFGFAFLPNLRRWKDEAEGRRAFLSVFWGTQLLVGLLYSCAGFCKVLGIVYDFPEGPTWFHPDALPLTLAENWPKSKITLLSEFLVVRPALGWVLNAGVVYLELLAVVAVFRPSLHRLWALGLILMHASIMHSMAIHFHQSIIVLALLLVATPFGRNATLMDSLLDLPGIGWGLRRLFRRAAVEPEQSHAPAWGRTHPVLFWWLPVTVLLYVPVGFSRLEVDQGDWKKDLFPVSAQWMYWRIDSSDRNVSRLDKIRKQLNKASSKK